ncbi:MAG: hypothetical protein ABIH82_06465 [Candidatus Woesearchaeota archaeon]
MVVKSYSFKTGLWKSLKNILIVVGIPALVLFVDNWTTILPNEWNAYAAPIMGFVAYLVKNYIENK